MGEELHNLEGDEESIFHSFNLPSWLNSTYDVRVLYYGKDEEGVPYYQVEAKAYSFDIGHDVKLTFKEISKDQDLRIINYDVVNEAMVGEEEVTNRIVVIFEKSKVNQCLFIRVID